MIASGEQDPAPLRLVLGSDSYAHTWAALTPRLDHLEAQYELASSTDCADQGNSPGWFPPDECGSIRGERA